MYCRVSTCTRRNTNTMKPPAVLAWAVIVGICTFSAVVAVHNPPIPPNLTEKEIHARVDSYVDSHLSSCAACAYGKYDPWCFCPQLAVAYDRGTTLGNWKHYPLGWNWVGRPVPFFRWDYHEQKWRRLWPFLPKQLSPL